ncbi:MAG: L,D-transpeptidase family protein [Gammaproteobacteria bacterium]
MMRRIMPAVALLALSCAAPATTLDPAGEALRRAVEALAEEPAIRDEGVTDFRLISNFYSGRDFRPAWTDPRRIDVLMSLLRDADLEGLRPEDYHLRRLESLLALPADGHGQAERLAERDILLTDALARYAFHLRFGKVDPSQLDAAWNLSRQLGDISPVEFLADTVAAPDLRAAVQPDYFSGPAYAAYRQTLADYRRVRDAGGWPAIPDGPTLKPGMEDARVPDLRRYLAATGDLRDGDLPAANEPARYDAATEAAVRRFQARHALDVDGAVGRDTLAAMNTPVQARIDQLRVNMERLRWVFRDLEDDFLIVNIAGFKALLVEDGQIAWTTRVVVGRPYRQTPVFQSTMTYLVFNPTWTVPPTILRKDVLPRVRADIGYLANQHMEVIDSTGRPVDPATVDWSGGSIPYQIRQKPGPWNSMGLVKFMFPNEHFVFLHDTPNKELFGKADRTFSSGCIRTERPLELAERLLAGQEDWNADSIRALVASGETKTVVLERPLTVMLMYWTVGFDANWQPVFYRDVYDRDGRVLEALDAPFRFRPPEGYEDAVR